MVSQFFIIVVALFASILTFFSGFGLGTILLPAMTIFYPVSIAIVLTGIVHFINGAFKVILIRQFVHIPTLLRFGVFAIPTAMLGAWLMTSLGEQEAILNYSLWGNEYAVMPLNFVVGFLMIGFTVIEVIPATKNISINKKFLPLGGAISGFFGGLTGHQGAFRTMFLIRANLTKEQFVATGSAFSFCVDLTRLSVYLKNLSKIHLQENAYFLGWAIGAALLGVVIGNRLLDKVDIKFIKYLISLALFVLGGLIMVGII